MKTRQKTPAIHPIIMPVPTAGLESINFYLVEAEDQLILVDAGIDFDDCWKYFKEALQESKWEVTDIDKIILTHNHEDHIGLVNRIRAETDIPVYAHPESIVRMKRDPEFMQQRADFFESLYKEMGCGSKGDKQIAKLKQSILKNKDQAVHGEIRTLEEGDMMNGFHIIEVPGHAPDHIILLHKENGILLGGDFLMNHIRPNALIEQNKEGKRMYSLVDYCESLEKGQRYNFSLVYAGHGDVVRNPHALIDQRLQEIEKKSESMREIVMAGPQTAAQVAKTYYPHKYETEFPLVMSQVIGHLDRLVSLGQLTIDKVDNILYYSAVS